MEASFANSPTVRSITQSSFLIRLSALVVACCVVTDLSVGYGIAVLILAATSYVGLRQRDLEIVRRHPFIALIDLLVVGAAVASQGLDSPLLLCSLTTALLLGLWVDTRFGLPVLAALVAMYGLGAASGLRHENPGIFYLLIVPFCYLMVWVLGAIIRRSVIVDQETQRSLADAITAAAATEERKRVARDLHDNLAKTLQAMTLVTSSLNDRTSGDPKVATSLDTLEQMCVRAVDDARRLMSNWRTTPGIPDATFADQVRALARSIPQGDGFTVRAEVIDDVNVASNEVRYEVLTCLREALLNARQHAGQCTARVRVTGNDSRLMISVADDGPGLDFDGDLPPEPAGHFGIVGIRERMEQIGGTATWASRPGSGMAVTLVAHPAGLIERPAASYEMEIA